MIIYALAHEAGKRGQTKVCKVGSLIFSVKVNYVQLHAILVLLSLPLPSQDPEARNRAKKSLFVVAFFLIG